MVRICPALACLLPVAVGSPPLAPPALAPPPRRPGLPSGGAVPWAPRSSATVAAPAEHGPASLRGQPVRARTYVDPQEAEAALMGIFESGSPSIEAMHYEAEVLRLPRVASGGPSVAALLDTLASAKPLGDNFDHKVLEGEWRLAFTNDLAAPVREEIARHGVDNVVGLSVVSSVSGTGIMDTTFEISLRGGRKKVMRLHGFMAQRGFSPSFSQNYDGDDHTLTEVEYSSESLVILRKEYDGDDRADQAFGRDGFTHLSRKTEVWTRLGSTGTQPLAGPASLWRFGLASDALKQAPSTLTAAIDGVKRVSAWLFAALAAMVSFSLVSPERTKYAVAAFAGQPIPAESSHECEMVLSRRNSRSVVARATEGSEVTPAASDTKLAIRRLTDAGSSLRRWGYVAEIVYSWLGMISLGVTTFATYSRGGLGRNPSTALGLPSLGISLACALACWFKARGWRTIARRCRIAASSLEAEVSAPSSSTQLPDLAEIDNELVAVKRIAWLGAFAAVIGLQAMVGLLVNKVLASSGTMSPAPGVSLDVFTLLAVSNVALSHVIGGGLAAMQQRALPPLRRQQGDQFRGWAS